MKDEHLAGIGLVVCFILFFLIPVFGGERMVYYRYILDMPTIGADLSQMLHYSKQLGENIYIDRNLYPPFASVFFSLFTSFSNPYLVLSFVTVLSFWTLFWIAPRTNAVLLIFLSGFVGYGFQFELERGQWNVIAMCLSMLGLRFWKKSKLLGGALLTLAIQLKIWPAIFLFELIREEKK